MHKQHQECIGFLLLGILLFLYGSVMFSAFTVRAESCSFSARQYNEKQVLLVRPDGLIHINHAEAEDLLVLPGIGETIAENILAERQKNGPFYYPEDLLSVKGIGKIKLAQICDYISFALYDSEGIGE